MKKSDMVRSMGFAAVFIVSLFLLVYPTIANGMEKRGGDYETIYNAPKTGSDLVPQSAEMTVGVAKDTLVIPANLSLAERIARGKYDWVNPKITEEHFPVDVSADYSVEYKLFHFNRYISSEDVVNEMGKKGYRPGTLAELLALGEAKPELQKQFPIIALGSLWRHSVGGRFVPDLRWLGSGRELRLYWFELGWGDDYRFLAVRK